LIPWTPAQPPTKLAVVVVALLAVDELLEEEVAVLDALVEEEEGTANAALIPPLIGVHVLMYRP